MKRFLRTIYSHWRIGATVVLFLAFFVLVGCCIGKYMVWKGW